MNEEIEKEIMQSLHKFFLRHMQDKENFMLSTSMYEGKMLREMSREELYKAINNLGYLYSKTFLEKNYE